MDVNIGAMGKIAAIDEGPTFVVTYVTNWGKKVTYTGPMLDILCYVLPSDTVLEVKRA